MNDYERILLECRYILSLNKNIYELSLIFHTDMDRINDDLMVQLPKLDTILYQRVNHVLNKEKGS